MYTHVVRVFDAVHHNAAVGVCVAVLDVRPDVRDPRTAQRHHQGIVGGKQLHDEVCRARRERDRQLEVDSTADQHRVVVVASLDERERRVVYERYHLLITQCHRVNLDCMYSSRRPTRPDKTVFSRRVRRSAVFTARC